MVHSSTAPHGTPGTPAGTPHYRSGTISIPYYLYLLVYRKFYQFADVYYLRVRYIKISKFELLQQVLQAAPMMVNHGKAAGKPAGKPTSRVS